MIIQIALIVLSFFILAYFLMNSNSIRVRAYKKIAMLLFVMAMIGFVLFPESLNVIAKKVGVGRGADLMLYGLFVAFVIFVLNVYLKFKAQQAELYKLARKVALLEAKSQLTAKKKGKT